MYLNGCKACSNKWVRKSWSELPTGFITRKEYITFAKDANKKPTRFEKAVIREMQAGKIYDAVNPDNNAAAIEAKKEEDFNHLDSRISEIAANKVCEAMLEVDKLKREVESLKRDVLRTGRQARVDNLGVMYHLRHFFKLEQVGEHGEQVTARKSIDSKHERSCKKGALQCFICSESKINRPHWFMTKQDKAKRGIVRRLTSSPEPALCDGPSSLVLFLLLLPLLFLTFFLIRRFRRFPATPSIPKARRESEVYGIRKDPLNRAERMV